VLLLIESGLVIRHNEISILFKVIPICVCVDRLITVAAVTVVFLITFEINIPTTSGTFVVCTYK